MAEPEILGQYPPATPAGLHTLCHVARDPVAVLSLPSGTILEANRAFLEACGLSELPPEGLRIFEFAGARLARAIRVWNGTTARLVPRASLKGMEGQVRLVPIPSARPPQAFLHFIPPRRARRHPPDRLQELIDERISQIRNFERLRSIGEAAAVIVHEVRIPLSSLRIAVERVRKSPVLDPSLAPRVEFALDQILRLDRLLSGIRTFTRPSALSTREIEAVELLTNALKGIQEAIGASNCGVSVEARPETLRITADPDRLSEAIQNVVMNAVEAMPQGGPIRITAAPSARRRGWVEIRVTDRGAGIPANVLDRVFQPFFTTKPSGTGLGLSIVRKIVELHGGFVGIAGEARGTTVVIELPAKPAS